jgi:hypothetical protein
VHVAPRPRYLVVRVRYGITLALALSVPPHAVPVRSKTEWLESIYLPLG